jgi:hypothetical protein
MPELRVGSEEHKRLFCREFVDTHHPYRVPEIRWPELSEADVERLRAMPFWDEAVQSEATAAARVRAMADVEPDGMMREAIAMQAYEEERHAALLASMTSHYGIKVGEARPARPDDAEWAFLRMGYGECFDSFFAFGLFKLSADTGLFPAPIVEIFDGVMQEEARHILFFTNWVSYRRVCLPVRNRPWFLARRGMGLALQALGRVRTALDLRGADAGDDFTMQVPEAVGEVTLRTLAERCLDENERRLANFDPRLIRPELVPRLIRLALRVVPGGRNGRPAA